MNNAQAADNLLFPDWPAPENVRAVSSKRTGGCSEGVFQSFNLGDHVGDDPARVKTERS
ncbi:laccase domain-containing protein [Alishewanella longhuensis]